MHPTVENLIRLLPDPTDAFINRHESQEGDRRMVSFEIARRDSEINPVWGDVVFHAPADGRGVISMCYGLLEVSDWGHGLYYINYGGKTKLKDHFGSAWIARKNDGYIFLCAEKEFFDLISKDAGPVVAQIQSVFRSL